MVPADNAKKLMNLYGKEKTPFLFIVDFDLQKPIVLRLDELSDARILFDIKGFSNSISTHVVNKKLEFKKFPVSFETYHSAFQNGYQHIRNGNTYLLNLTFPTRVESNYSLIEIYFKSPAKFKLLYEDSFVVFSPEIFVRIEGNTIASFPMKGTIDASLPDAEKKILTDEKEEAEHATIVDLIRNDLSMVSSDVKVENYRYVEKIKTNDKDLLQVSSRITGQLQQDYCGHIGDILFRLLPAGSVTGAPKKKTVEIIKAVESYERGYYTGVFGYFDGTRLESGVMIRFIEKIDGKLYYKSGGGITAYSSAESEYQEMVDKVYVPLT